MSTRVRSRRGTHGSASGSADHQEQKSDEEIVMTPLKAKVGQIIRVERVPTGVLLDDKKVHYLAEGPYKGIVVNKAANVRPNKTGPEAVRRFIAYVHDDREATKEVREIRFWFKPEANSEGEMEEHSTAFFKELIDPKNFPKDHLQFVKRVLTLVRKYLVLKFIELEMRPYTWKDDPVDVRGQNPDFRRKLRKATSVIDPPPVLQSASTSDLSASNRRRKVRRLTVSGTDHARTADNDIPTVFVYVNPKDGTDQKDEQSKKKKKKKTKRETSISGGQHLLRSGSLENLNDIRTDESVFNHNGEAPEVYGIVKKNRKSTKTSAQSSLIPETAGPLLSPIGTSRNSIRIVENQFTTSPVEKRRSSRRSKSSTSLTSPGVTSTPIRDSYTGSDVFDSAPLKDPMVNGGRSSSSSRRKSRPVSLMTLGDSKVIGLLEDAFPTMLSVDDLVRMSRMKEDDVESELGKLSSVGVATEVESGFWVRSHLLRRLTTSSSSSTKNGRLSGQDADIHRNEFRMVASSPSLAPEDQPTIAIITSLYCEKLAVDAMMEVKKTYVRHKTKGEGLVYTVGLIDRHRIVSTKLSKLGNGSETRLSAENTIPRLLESFDKIEHILLVGVGGGVANYDDDNNHIRLGDVVVSKATDRTNQFVYFHVTGSDKDQSSSITLETRPWASADSELRSVVTRMQKSPKKLWKQMDAVLLEATRDLDTAGQMTFTRPPPDSDQLYRSSMKTRTPVPHPQVIPGSVRDQRPHQPLVHFGAVASGKILNRDDAVRGQFCLQQKVKAVDGGFQRVLDFLENQRGLGYTLIRGVADYSDGSKSKEWQSYAALVAAAVMKCIVVRLSLPGDED